MTHRRFNRSFCIPAVCCSLLQSAPARYMTYTSFHRSLYLCSVLHCVAVCAVSACPVNDMKTAWSLFLFLQTYEWVTSSVHTSHVTHEEFQQIFGILNLGGKKENWPPSPIQIYSRIWYAFSLFLRKFHSVNLFKGNVCKPGRARFAEKKMEFHLRMSAKRVLFYFQPNSNRCRTHSGAVHDEREEWTSSWHGLCGEKKISPFCFNFFFKLTTNRVSYSFLIILWCLSLLVAVISRQHSGWAC